MKDRNLAIVIPDPAGAQPQAERIQAIVAALGLPLQRFDEPTLRTLLADPAAGEREPAVLLFPPELTRPLALALARAARSRWPGCELLFVQCREAFADFRRGLGLAPLLGSYWSIVEFDEATLGDRVVQAATTARHRARFRSTLDQANQHLQTRPEPAKEQRRHLADHYLASFIDSAQEAIIGLDLQYRVMFWSAGAEELFGLGSREAVGTDVRGLPFWDRELDDAGAALNAGKKSLLFERTCDLGDDERSLEVLCSGVRDDAGTLLGLSLIIRDVSAIAARRAAKEERLEAAGQHLLQLFHQAPGFVAVSQGPRHIMELANRAFYQLVGHREVIGRPASETFPQVEGQTIIELLDRVYATRRAFVGLGLPVYVQRSREAPPQRRHLDFVFQPVLSEQGLVTGIFCQGHDVTQQHLAQEQLQRSEEHLQALVEERTRELERSQQALLQSQKLEAIGKLTGGVAHDFNNVLQIIGANLQLLSNALHDARLTSRLDAASAAVERGAKLSSQLLAFARRQPLSPAPTNLARMLRGMDELLRRALGEYVEIETVVAGGLWTTLIDPNQLENVLLNLAINARDAMPEGGRLTLELGNAMLDDAYARLAADVTPGQYVLLAVSDTGCGMSRDTIERAFEPFFTTKPEGQGTGLGLSMAYGFAKQSGGHIRIYSEPGNGTTIKLYLPRTLQEEVEPVPQISGAVMGGSEIILVVEDDPAVQATVIDYLSGLGYHVLRASDAQSALSILQSGLAIDLLFTDVVMPGPLRSPELARQARQLLPDIAVLFTSGYTQNAIIHGGKLDAGIELISKPYRLADLARKIRQLLARRPTQPALPAPAGEAGSRLDVLVVEDQPELLEMTCDMLDVLGHAAAGFAAAEEALGALRQRRFDVLMTDLNLPGLSGLELAARARALQPALKIVFASGYGEPATDIEAKVLAKPFTLEQLETLLTEFSTASADA